MVQPESALPLQWHLANTFPHNRKFGTKPLTEDLYSDGLFLFRLSPETARWSKLDRSLMTDSPTTFDLLRWNSVTLWEWDLNDQNCAICKYFFLLTPELIWRILACSANRPQANTFARHNG
jgi:hypothetical protein